MSRRLAKILSLSVLAVFLLSPVADACTTIIVGKEASTDGSVMVTHTCDGWYDNRLEWFREAFIKMEK